jgi:hypothetical protein
MVVESFLIGRGIVTVDIDGMYTVLPEHHHIYKKSDGKLTLDQAFVFLREYLRNYLALKNT